MRYLLDDNGYCLGVVNSGSEGVEISEDLPAHTNIQRVKFNGSKWIIEDSETLRIHQEKYEANQYKRNRLYEYPSITDVVVALAEKQEGDDTMWNEITALRQKVKSENPKPK